MKNLPHIIGLLHNRPLVITREKHAAICAILEARLAGEPARPLAYDDGERDDGRDDSGYLHVGDTAIIPVHGILGKHLGLFEMVSGGCDLDTVSNMVDVAVGNANVRQIVFDFRTPGGSVTGLPELGRKIAAITSKRTIAFTDSECLSGGMWLAECCENFYATESARLGSIGVWTAYLDYSRAMEMAGERMQAISAGKYKLLGAYWKPLTAEETKLLQAEVDKIHDQFKDVVNLRREVADEYMEGQMFDGPEALDAGLIDGLVEDLDELL